jgi:Mg2+ and Co2+ transporter CorA
MSFPRPNHISFNDDVAAIIEISDDDDSNAMSTTSYSQTPVSSSSSPLNDRRIDFDLLEKLLAPKGANDGGPQPYENIRLDEAYLYPTNIPSVPKFQRIILYSGSSESTYRASSFNALNIHEDLRTIFSDDVHHPWWLDVQNPSETELRVLCSAFRIHPLTFEDIATRESQEKIVDYNTYYFASVWSYHVVEVNEGNAYEPCTIYTVVFPSGALSFSFSTTVHAMNVLERIELLKGFVAVKSDWIFYAFVLVF